MCGSLCSFRQNPAGKSDDFAAGLQTTSSADTVVPNCSLPAQRRRSQSFSSIAAGLTVLSLHLDVTALAACCKIPSLEADKLLCHCSATQLIDSNARKRNPQNLTVKISQSREEEHGRRGDSATFFLDHNGA